MAKKAVAKKAVTKKASRKASVAPAGGFTVQKGVPIPEGRGRYPFAQMDVGDSFLGNERARAAASTAGKKDGKRFASRKSGDQIRIWRIA